MQLEKNIAKVMEDHHVAGMSVALIRDGQIVSAEGYGKRDIENDLPMTGDTVMPIGSITKSFTALSLSMLADEGKFDWDEPVITYIPHLRLSDPSLTEKVIGRDLLCHCTGIPGYDTQIVYAVRDDKAEMVKTLEYLQTNAELRARFQYNNQMIALAGYLVDVLSGKSYEEFVRERIFTPLGMTSSDFEVDSLAMHEDASKGYVYDNDTFIEPPYLHLGAFTSAGGIVSSAADMAKYALFQLGDGTWNGERLVSEAMMNDMHTKQMAGTPYLWEFEEIQRAEYGLGWCTDIYRGRKMISHGGDTSGFTSQLALLPDENFAVVALTNASSCLASNAVGYYAVDEALGVDDVPDWSGRFSDVTANLVKEIMAGMQARAEAKVPDTATSVPLEELAGKYEHPGFGTIELSVEGQNLAGSWGGMPVTLTHYNYDEFDLMLSVLGMSVPAKFIIRDGKVSGLEVVVEPGADVEPVVFRLSANDTSCTMLLQSGN